jgi:hypothetical protein
LNLFEYKNKFFLNKLINISSFFLSKFFYYRHLNKFFDRKIIKDYNILKPFNFLNLSFLESNIYNLSFKRKLHINEKLDKFFKNLSNFSLKSYKIKEKLFEKNMKKYKKILIKNSIKKKSTKKNLFYFNKNIDTKNKNVNEFIKKRIEDYSINFNNFIQNKSKIIKEMNEVSIYNNKLYNEIQYFKTHREFRKLGLLKKRSKYKVVSSVSIKKYIKDKKFLIKTRNYIIKLIKKGQMPCKKNLLLNYKKDSIPFYYKNFNFKYCKAPSNIYKYKISYLMNKKNILQRRDFMFYRYFVFSNFFTKKEKIKTNTFNLDFAKKCRKAKDYLLDENIPPFQEEKFKKVKRAQKLKFRKFYTRKMKKDLINYKKYSIDNNKGAIFINMFLIFYRNKNNVSIYKNIYYNFWFSHR